MEHIGGQIKCFILDWPSEHKVLIISLCFFPLAWESKADFPSTISQSIFGRVYKGRIHAFLFAYPYLIHAIWEPLVLKYTPWHMKIPNDNLFQYRHHRQDLIVIDTDKYVHHIYNTDKLMFRFFTGKATRGSCLKFGWKKTVGSIPGPTSPIV